MKYIAFNGDADGLCALQQLHLCEELDDAILVTGVKRDIDLVKRVEACPGDEATILDVSLDVNRAALLRLLALGVHVRYFDHHHAGDIPRHARLQAVVDASPQVCTSVLVDRHLRGLQRPWAVVGAFGDNLDEVACSLGRKFSAEEQILLKELGILLNYNAYGESMEDLHFPPAELHARLRAYTDPLAFIRTDEAMRELRKGYRKDMAYAGEVMPHVETEHATVYLLPDTSWARRVSGTLASRLARKNPARATAVVLPIENGFQVSVRAPLQNPRGASALCRQFPTGGGREGAAGINQLAAEDLERFTARFLNHFDPAAAVS